MSGYSFSCKYPDYEIYSQNSLSFLINNHHDIVNLSGTGEAYFTQQYLPRSRWCGLFLFI